MYFTQLIAQTQYYQIASYNLHCIVSVWAGNWIFICNLNEVQSPVSHRRDLVSILERFLWYLWCTKWHWDGFSRDSFVFPLLSSFHQCSALTFMSFALEGQVGEYREYEINQCCSVNRGYCKKIQQFNLSASRELYRNSGFANPATLFVSLI